MFGAVTGLFLPPTAGTPPLALAPKLVVGVIAAGAGPAMLSPMAGAIAPSRQSACMVSRAEDVLRSRRRVEDTFSSIRTLRGTPIWFGTDHRE